MSPDNEKKYDYTHYEKFSKEEWRVAIEDGKFPGEGRHREYAETFLIGGYLLKLHKLKKIDASIYGSEFQRLKKLAKLCIEYFEEQEEGKGFQRALEYLNFYLAHDEGTFIGKSRWSLELMLTKTSYRNWTPEARASSNNPLSRNDMGVTIQKGEDRSSIQLKKS